jgi:hypothetical protein
MRWKPGKAAGPSILLASLLAACGGAARPASEVGPRAPAQGAIERFRVDEGVRDNWLVRQGPVAAHLVVSREPRPRVVVAFPAGNEGVGMWFADDAPQALEVAEPPEPVIDGDQRGVRFTLRARGELRPTTVLIGSVRAIRDLVEGGGVAEREQALGEAWVWPVRVVDEGTTTWEREHLDGEHRSRLTVEDAGGGLFRLTAMTNWEPLTPIPRDEVLNERGRETLARATGPERQALEAALDALAFLSYDEKLLAGSWRFATYFGRDTMMSLRLLAPVVSDRVMRAGLRAVLDRVDDQGQVAHEEDIGGQAIYRHFVAGDPRERWDQMVLDYRMVDDDFMLPLLAAAVDAGDVDTAALERNRAYVLARAAEPWVDLLPDEPVGDWRDSLEGLGGGRTSYSVDAALVPAALAALGAGVDPALLARWRAARQAFAVRRTVEEVRAGVARYLESLPAEERDALRAQQIPGGGTVGELADGGAPPPLLARGLAFHGVALDAERRPVPVMNSDDGFLLLDLELEPAEVEEMLVAYRLPFPLGLRTPAGVLVASPVHSDRPADLETFDRTKYHGSVIWSWQHALLLVGLARTLERLEARGASDEAATRAAGAVRETLADLRELDGSLGEFQGSELWTWGARDGRIVPVAFGTTGHATESNAVQLWSTVRLGVAAELDRALSGRSREMGTPP